MKKYILLSLIGIFTAYLSIAQEQDHHKKSDGNTANEYMHQSSVESLTRHFESSDRDAYQHPELVLQYLGELEGKKVMDIGAGTGYFSVKLAAAGAEVIAADVNDEFQQYLKKRIEDNHIKNIELRKVPYDSPTLKDHEVDMVLLVNTYHHIEERSEYFSKVKNGLKQNGELVVIDFFKSDIPFGPGFGHKVSIDVVVTELKQAGFDKFEVEVSLLPYQYIIRVTSED